MQLIPKLDVISAIILFGVFQAILVSILFLRKSARPMSMYLGLVLIVLAIIEIESFLNYSGYMIYLPHLVNISPPLIFLLGPLTYLYVRKVIHPQNESRFPILHFVPAIAFFAYSFFFYLQSADFKIWAFITSHHPELVAQTATKRFPTDPFHIQGIVVIEGLAIHLMTYVLMSLRLVLRNQNKSQDKNWTWLRFLCVNLLGGSIIFLLTGGVVNGQVLFNRVLPPFMIDFYSTFLVYSISFYWLSRVILPGRVEKKYVKSEMPPELRVHKLDLIKEIMEKEKPYKASDFSLDWLAKRTSISSHHLSQVINTEMGMTFVEFINLCRINEAQEILKTPEHQNVKVEVLAYELGYQSKSAFFNAFKRHTSTTPARFREEIRARS